MDAVIYSPIAIERADLELLSSELLRLELLLFPLVTEDFVGLVSTAHGLNALLLKLAKECLHVIVLC